MTAGFDMTVKSLTFLVYNMLKREVVKLKSIREFDTVLARYTSGWHPPGRICVTVANHLYLHISASIEASSSGLQEHDITSSLLYLLISPSLDHLLVFMNKYLLR